MEHLRVRRLGCHAALIAASLFAQAVAQAQSGYVQTNLIADVPAVAAHTDPNLIDAWGIAFASAGPWWVNAAGTGLSLLYSGSGGPFPPGNQLIVTIPPPAAGGPAVPTGIVFNGTGKFNAAPGVPSLFLFASARGTISAWNPFQSTAAVLKVTTPNAAYTGLALGKMRGQDLLYAANFASGSVDVFDGSFNKVSLNSGAFHDANVPAGYAPFNVASIDGSIYVTFAKPNNLGRSTAGAGLGYVDKFNPEGQFQLQLQHGNWMNGPWAVVQAPFGFGPLSGSVLVGNFGSGQIASFHPSTGVFAGLMNDPGGSPVAIEGLWGLEFGNGLLAGPGHDLFFAAGPQNETHGLFGSLKLER